MNNLNLLMVQSLARTAMGGEVVAICGLDVIIKQDKPTWEDKPFVFTKVCHQPESKNHEYSFYSSDYDLSKDRAQHILSNLMSIK